MKIKSILIISLVAMFLLISVGGTLTTYTNRVNRMNPVANAVKMGNMFDAINAALRGEDVLCSSITLSAGTSDTAKVKIAAFNAWFDGSFMGFPAAEKAFTATTHDVDSSKYATYKLSTQSDSTLTLTMSAATYATADSAIDALAATPTNEINLGYVLLYASGGAFDASTTKLNASTLTVTYVPATNYIIDLDQ